MRRCFIRSDYCLAGELTSFARCYYFKLGNKREFGFTDYAEDLTINGLVYVACESLRSSSIEFSDNLAADNLELNAVIDHQFIKTSELMAGYYDGAYVEIFLINYQKSDGDRILLKSGHIGEIRCQGERFIVEIRGLSQKLNINLANFYSPVCRTWLGSKQCGINIENYQIYAKVVRPVNKHSFITSYIESERAWYNFGIVKFISGGNQGLSMGIKETSSEQVTLVSDLFHHLKAGDEFVIIAGCDKQFNTCYKKFNNALNFRGEPGIPGVDEMLKTSGTFK